MGAVDIVNDPAFDPTRLADNPVTCYAPPYFVEKTTDPDKGWPHAWQVGGNPITDGVVANVQYAYDLNGIDMNSDSGRVYTSCFRESARGVQPYWGAPHRGGVNALCIDNAVIWLNVFRPDAQIWSAGGFIRWGLVPNDRICEEAEYARDETEKEAMASVLDDIFTYECNADRTPWDPWGNFSHNQNAYNNHTWGPANATWADGAGSDTTTWRCFYGANGQPHYWYPQRGIYAQEPRWRKTDSAVRYMCPFDYWPGWFFQMTPAPQP